MEKQYNQLLKKYTRYIEKIANSYSNNEYEITKDLEQVGRIKLFEIMNKIDEDKGKEVSYITTMIKYAMKEYLTNNLRIIRIPSHIQHSSKHKDETQILSTLSLDFIVNEEQQTKLIDLIVIEDEDSSPTDEELTFKERFKMAIETLKPQWQFIILNYYGYDEERGPMTLEEIGIELGISKEAVRQQLNKAKEKVKQIMKK